MKVFLCWSGPTSHKVAEYLDEWLPYVIQQCKPFISSGSIFKGARWNVVLAQELNDAKFGIICVTPFNLHCPWLNYEAGALAKAVDMDSVSPLLLSVNPNELIGPISQFQSTIYEYDDVYKLVYSLNAKLPVESQISHGVLCATFKKWWPNLKNKLDNVFDDVVETRSGIPWLLTLQEVMRIPRDRLERVLVVTRNLWKHTLERDCIKFIKSGIEAELPVEFHILFNRDENENADSQIQLKSEFTDDQQNYLRFYPVGGDQFREQAVTDYIIMNPDSQDRSHPPHAYIKVPCSDCEHWIKVDDQASAGFAGRFTKICKELDKQNQHSTSAPVEAE